jgi:DNA-directed RNA polymerase subunit RPC12/RpoP
MLYYCKRCGEFLGRDPSKLTCPKCGNKNIIKRKTKQNINKEKKIFKNLTKISYAPGMVTSTSSNTHRSYYNKPRPPKDEAKKY